MASRQKCVAITSVLKNLGSPGAPVFRRYFIPVPQPNRSEIESLNQATSMNTLVFLWPHLPLRTVFEAKAGDRT